MSAGVLALDQGSHASRACLFDDSGTLLASSVVPVATQHPGAAQVEHDADELLRSLRAAAAQAVTAARASHPELVVAAAGLAVQRSTIVCCARADGRVLAPAISWQDHRNAAWLSKLRRHRRRAYASSRACPCRPTMVRARSAGAWSTCPP